MITTEKFVAASTDALDTFSALASIHFDSAERLSGLTFAAARSTLSDGVKDVLALSSAKDPKALVGTAAGMVEPALTRGVGYVRGCYAIAADLSASVNAVLSVKVEAANKDLDVALEKLSASTPVGGEAVVSMVKSARSSANNAIEEAAKAAREAVSVAESNINKATDAAVKAAAKAAKTVAA
ncbi:MAG: phasin family protein [Rhodocyclaceae bacterium]|nr:phasin family protein [Rhodocyclaceae bacterium]